MSSQPIEGSISDYDATPSVYQFLNKTYITMLEFSDYDKYPTNYTFLSELPTVITFYDVRWMIISTLIFALTRCLMDRATLSLASWLQIRPFEQTKFSESFWKGSVTLITFIYSFYLVVLNEKTAFFHQTCRVWINYSFGDDYFERRQLPTNYYCIYMMQLGFYIHSIYATLFLDEKRKDQVTMLVHHALAIGLLLISFSARYYEMGALLVLLHDINDVIMEFTKLNNYLKTRGGTFHKINGYFTTIGFCLFFVSWCYTRLYLYPLKAIHMANWCVYLYHKTEIPMWLIFNLMLWPLFVLHLYWTIFIMRLVVRIATTNIEEVDDCREVIPSEYQKIKLSDKNGSQNGHNHHKNE